MADETFQKLQHSEGIICQMASRILAAYISAGKLTADNEDQLMDHALSLAIKLARKGDRIIESDDESGKPS